MSLGKGLCYLQSHRMVVQTMPMRTGGKDDIQKLENLETSHEINCQIFSFIYRSHPPGLFLQGQEGACCIASVYSVLSTVPGTKQPLKNIYPEEHTGHINDDSNDVVI